MTCMNFTETLEFLGGSIFGEECRGNFSSIQSRIDDLQREADSSLPGTSNLVAKTIFLRAIFNLLIGNNAEASSSLLRICDPAGEFSITWKLRAVAYLNLFIAWWRFPPMLRFPIELGSFAGQFFAMQSGYLKNRQKMQDTLVQRLGEGTGLDQFERKVLLILSSVSLHLSTEGTQHPSFPRTLGQSAPAVESDWSRIVRTLQLESVAIDCPDIARYLSRILLEIEIARGAPDLDEKFRSLRDEYSSAGDWAGLASIYVLDADRILSPPFSSPLSLNLIVTDSSNATIGNQKWDAIEASIWLNDDATAQDHYLRAFENFERAGASRGCAAVQLRWGCIKHASALKASIQSPEWFEEIRAANHYFSMAHELFGLDVQSQHLVSTHKILLDITSGQGQDLVSHARLIGSSAFQNANPIVAQFCGLLIMRFGYRQWLDHSRSNIAFQCYECALGCFSSLQDQYLTLLATTSQLELYTLLSDHSQARALTERVVPQFRVLLSTLKPFKDENLDQSRMWVKNLALDFPPHIFRSYYYTRDLNALKRWKEEVDRLEDSESVELGTLLDRPEITSYLHNHGHQAESFSTLERQRRRDNVRLYQYYVADIESQAAFQEFDVDKAESLLKALTVKIGSGIADILSTYTYTRLGEHEKARRVLDRIPNAILLNETVKQGISSDYTWSRRTAGSYFWDPNSGESALNACVQAQHWRKAEQILKRIKTVSTSFLDIEGLDREGDMWHRLLHAGLIAEHSDNLDEAFQLLLSSADVAERRRQSTTGEDARRASFFTLDSGEVFQALARIALRFATSEESSSQDSPSSRRFDLRGKTWPEQALAFMEQGKARALLDSMLATRSQEKTDGLKSGASWAYNKRLYFDLLAVPAESRSDAEKAELQTLERDLKVGQDIISELQSSDLLFDAATRPQTNLRAHYSVIPPNAAVIEFGFSQQGLIIFCIDSSGIRSTRQSKMTFIEARRIVFKYLREVATEPSNKSSDRTERLEKLSRQLSDELLASVTEDIHDKSHIIFIPSQPALVFPFSALLYDGKPLFLSKAVSQAPSLATLSKLIQKSHPIVSPKVSALAKPGIMKAGAKEPPLKMAGIEAITLGHIFNRPPTDVKNTSSDDFRAVLSDSDIVHLSTHGHTDPRSPWQAWISLRERFRVVDLTSVACGASMVFFGACLSGLGKATIGNDVTGFSHSMLSSGALVYLGAVWRVDDVSTMLLVVLFYRGLAKSAGDVSVAEYWRRAQVSLYHKSLEEVKALTDDILRGLDAAHAAGFEPEKFVKKGKAHLRNARDHLDMDPRDPFTWAPFIIIGNGNLNFDMRREVKAAGS
ncbi:MAG: hypothetical protein Q9161_000477 [Pseudevernia consocians]